MCGRCACTLAPDEIVRQTGARRWVDGMKIENDSKDATYRPSFNAAPTSWLPVMVAATCDTLIKSECSGVDQTTATDHSIKCEKSDSLQTTLTPTTPTMPTAPIKIEQQSLTNNNQYQHNETQRTVECTQINSQHSNSWHREIRVMKWGLVPSFSKEPKTTYSTSNARSEALTTNNMWRRLLARNRCVALADGYFEWKTTDEHARVKQPYYIQRTDGQLIAMAALFDVWRPHTSVVQSHQPKTSGVHNVSAVTLESAAAPTTTTTTTTTTTLYSFSVITTDCAPELAWLHHRMPVVFQTPEEMDVWLNPNSPLDQCFRLLRPSAVGLKWHAAPTIVNSVRNNSIDCIKPVEHHKAKGIARFFQPQVKKEKESTTTSDESHESNNALKQEDHRAVINVTESNVLPSEKPLMCGRKRELEETRLSTVEYAVHESKRQRCAVTPHE